MITNWILLGVCYFVANLVLNEHVQEKWKEVFTQVDYNIAIRAGLTSLIMTIVIWPFLAVIQFIRRTANFFKR